MVGEEEVLKSITWIYDLGMSPISRLYAWRFSMVNDDSKCSCNLEFESVCVDRFPSQHWDSELYVVAQHLVDQFFHLGATHNENGADDCNTTSLRIATSSRTWTCTIYDCNNPNADQITQHAVTVFLEILGKWEKVVSAKAFNLGAGGGRREGETE